MDFSTFEYLPMSRDIILSAPSSPTSQIFDIDGDIEVVDFGMTDQPRELRIRSDLSTDERDSLIQLLGSYLDVFAWSYEDMPGLDPSIVKEEIQKQLYVGFLSVVEYPEWLANVVPVPKKDSKVRVCVDFRDLNKASSKDDFPLSHINMLVNSTTGYSMLSFMDGFSGYSQILMAPEDMEKTSFITEWGTYCYRVMPFGLKNAGATYQRAATTLFHDMMHRDVEVYVDDMIVKSRDRSDHLAALERFFERIKQFRLRLNPKKCTFGVTSGKLLGYMVNERGIKVDPDKIRAILDMPAPRTEREVRGFLGRLQYISRFIARLTDICEPIFRLLRKSQPTVWDDQCQRPFKRIREYLLLPSILAPPTPGRPLLLYLLVSDMALGCMLAQLDDSGKYWAIYYLSKRMLHYETRPALVGHLMRWLVLLTEFDIHYVTQKSIRWSIVADHLASLPVSDDRAIDDDFPDEDVAVVTSLSGWRMYFDGAANHSGYGIDILLISPHETALKLEIRQMEVYGDSNLVLRQIQGEWKTRDAKLRPYHAYLELLVARFDDLRYTHLPRAQNRFADALATLASMIDIPADATVRPLLIESRSAPTCCCLIDDAEPDDGLPWYHDIYHFLRLGVYPEAATTKEKRGLRQLAARFVICGETLYRRSPDGMLLLCLDRASADQVMREVHAGVCGSHMGGHMLALWGIDVIGKISPKSSSGHEFILVAIDYFTKWVEAASYARLMSSGVASFIILHIICRYRVPHELISDRGVHFRAEVDTLVQRYGIRHHRSSAYKPQTNGGIEATNKNIKRIYGRWLRLLGIGATPYSLVYGMEGRERENQGELAWERKLAVGKLSRVPVFDELCEVLQRSPSHRRRNDDLCTSGVAGGPSSGGHGALAGELLIEDNAQAVSFSICIDPLVSTITTRFRLRGEVVYRLMDATNMIYCYIFVGGKLVQKNYGQWEYVGGRSKGIHIYKGMPFEEFTKKILEKFDISFDAMKMHYTFKFNPRVIQDLEDENDLDKVVSHSDEFANVYLVDLPCVEGIEANIPNTELAIGGPPAPFPSSNASCDAIPNTMMLSRGFVLRCADSEYTPLESIRFREAILGSGHTFKNAEEFCNAIYQMSLGGRFEYKYKKNSPTHMSVKCSVKGCPWKITAHAVERNVILRVHTYQVNHNHIAQDECSSKVKVSSKRGAVVVEDVFRTTLDYLPHQICKDFERDHGVQLTYNQAWHLKEKAKERIYGVPRESYTFVLGYAIG
ncbi:Transposon Ty3-G Gag-Pol polyprotein [Vitis vinifera]|uniref:Transposon Ty3-G Gag-Pol polyprotein n=1 Tax=Vitis vinifera TaxID=29760 RepID=A0A438KP23_VITVI|nr:Transposon Ty3-G Gag-Pol polyprotein [Vitis vinifera]